MQTAIETGPGAARRTATGSGTDIGRTLRLIGEELDIRIVVRPWWGSVRMSGIRHHVGCGGHVIGRPPSYSCRKCRQRGIASQETRLVSRSRHWLCPGGHTSSQVKWPEVRSGTVILWQGRCGVVRGHRRHSHSQDLEVVDVGETAFLLRVSVGASARHFLVGRDDGHPFVTSVQTKVCTVQDAFDWIMPGYVRNALVLGKRVRRQGDWFFVPYGREPAANMGRYGSAVPWLRPARRRGVPYRGARLHNTRHTASLLVYTTVQGVAQVSPVVRGTVRAPDHPPLELDGWHVAVRRRALPEPSYDRRPNVDD